MVNINSSYNVIHGLTDRDDYSKRFKISVVIDDDDDEFTVSEAAALFVNEIFEELGPDVMDDVYYAQAKLDNKTNRLELEFMLGYGDVDIRENRSKEIHDNLCRLIKLHSGIDSDHTVYVSAEDYLDTEYDKSTSYEVIRTMRIAMGYACHAVDIEGADLELVDAPAIAEFYNSHPALLAGLIEKLAIGIGGESIDYREHPTVISVGRWYTCYRITDVGDVQRATE